MMFRKFSLTFLMIFLGVACAYAKKEPKYEQAHQLTPEQAAAVEALTRGLVNKFLHPPMQAIKQAAREGDSVKLDALCDAWSVSVDGSTEGDRHSSKPATQAASKESEKIEEAKLSEPGVEVRR